MDLKSPLWLFHFCGLRFGVYDAQFTTKNWSLPWVTRRSRRKQFSEKFISSSPMQKPSLNVSQKELFTVLCCICTPYLFSVRYCEVVLADRLYCKKFLWFVFASILQSDHYGKSMLRTITAISHCQHSHNVIHSFWSSTKYKTLCCLIFA